MTTDIARQLDLWHTFAAKAEAIGAKVERAPDEMAVARLISRLAGDGVGSSTLSPARAAVRGPRALVIVVIGGEQNENAAERG